MSLFWAPSWQGKKRCRVLFVFVFKKANPVLRDHPQPAASFSLTKKVVIDKISKKRYPLQIDFLRTKKELRNSGIFVGKKMLQKNSWFSHLFWSSEKKYLAIKIFFVTQKIEVIDMRWHLTSKLLNHFPWSRDLETQLSSYASDGSVKKKKWIIFMVDWIFEVFKF